MTISKSPDRHTFQKEGYIKRCEEQGKLPDPAYIHMYKTWREEADAREKDLAWAENNMEYDLRSTPWILDKARASDAYAQNLYAAMCNNEFQKNEFMPRLAGKTWGCSWRYAGGIIADMRQEGDYINWYCSGIGGPVADHESTETHEEWQKRTGFVPEGVVTEEIEADLKKLGWYVVDAETE
jgi:hypothetical protein